MSVLSAAMRGDLSKEGVAIMTALITALIPLLIQLIGGASLKTILSGITVTQWEDVATQLLQAGPQVMADLPKIVGALHPQLAQMQPALQNMTTTLQATNSPTQAATTMQTWLANNGMGAINIHSGNIGEDV